MTKVCHITSVHPAHDVRIFHKECTSLAKAGFDVSLICANAETEEKNGVHIIGVTSKSTSRAARALSTVNQIYVKAKEIDADIYHLHDPELLRIALTLKRGGKKVIFDVHEDLPRQILSKHWIPRPLRITASKVVEKLEKIICKRLDAIITVTEFITSRFKYINKNTVTVNNYPLDHEISGDGLPIGKTKAICYIGSISQIRGLQYLVDALDVNSHVTLSLAGSWSPQEFKADLEARKGWKRVEEFGLVSRKEVSKIMEHSIAGMVTFLPEPNHINAQPNKMFEYMSAGLPVIGSDFPLWREIIDGNECGLCVDPSNPQKIADAIMIILENPDLAERMGQNGRKAIIEKYNWNNEAAKLVSIYNNLGSR